MRLENETMGAAVCGGTRVLEEEYDVAKVRGAPRKRWLLLPAVPNNDPLTARRGWEIETAKAEPSMGGHLIV